MGGSRSLAELSSVVQRSLSSIDQALKANGSPQPSLDRGSAVFTPPEGLEETRLELYDAIDELQSLLRSPTDHLYQRTTLSFLELGTYDLVTHFEIPQALGLEETLSYAELGRRIGLPEDDTRRIVRGAISLRLFDAVVSPSQGEEKIRHNTLSATLATDPELSSFLRAMATAGNALLVNGAKALRMGDISQCAFSIAHDGKSFFDYAKDHPELEDEFKKAMTMQSRAPGYHVSATAEAVGWGDGNAGSQWCPETIVDVGGSTGTLSKALLVRYPKIRSATVQDLPEVVAGQQQNQQQHDKEFAGRLSFAAHNFFQDQPVKNADAYLLRTILHDWPDERAAEILRRQIPALKPGARIIINDFCVPPPAPRSEFRDRPARAYDLLMRTVFNGKERSLDDWKRLLAAADPRFELKQVTTPEGAKLSVIEVVWRG
ncbi:S-adenosyl-L-methionine-dependent methyltransferase [Biscogniauxia marginata]|nr:S-adenosyl-L-methionine-dependent methyltransferase [Biscogniauxia marginata]